MILDVSSSRPFPKKQTTASHGLLALPKPHVAESGSAAARPVGGARSPPVGFRLQAIFSNNRNRPLAKMVQALFKLFLSYIMLLILWRFSSLKHFCISSTAFQRLNDRLSFLSEGIFQWPSQRPGRMLHIFIFIRGECQFCQHL